MIDVKTDALSGVPRVLEMALPLPARLKALKEPLHEGGERFCPSLFC